ncbi:MAG TPA: hypothetical protein VIT45_08585 [Allosphingosinicella sp.]
MKFVVALLLAGAGADFAPPAAEAVPVGTVAFANSGAPAAQQPFLRGLALLHNFEYASAAAEFRRAQSIDADFVMAFWGEAMTYNHPLWSGEQDLDAARAVLARLGPTREARLSKARTDRERLWLEAVERLFGDGTKDERDRAYSKAMAELSRHHPEDVDAQAFYALSLQGIADPATYPSRAIQSAALLEELLPKNPRHPGVLHYMIHAYDDPVHAPLGLRAARVYADVAAGAPHALHMTSHIFLPLGRWADVERSNLAAVEATNRRRAAAGQPAQHCGHDQEWLAYALLQQGKIAEADRRIALCRESAIPDRSAVAPVRAQSQTEGNVYRYSRLVLMRVVETGEWGPGQRISADTYPRALFNFAYADLLAAGSDIQRLRAARARLQQLGGLALPEAGWGEQLAERWRSRVGSILRQAEALEALRSGDVERGVRELRAVADVNRDGGIPDIEKPSEQLLGEELERLGRIAEAQAAFERATAVHPGLRRSTAGLRRTTSALAQTEARRPTADGN